MRTYRCVIAYDGTRYHGWQVQPDAVTVAGTLESTFKTIFGHTTTLIGASRTDAGVHALGQVAILRTDMSIDPSRLRNAWNGGLPRDILIRSIELVPDSFHPQYDVLSKTYYYHIFTRRAIPFFAPYGSVYRFPFDLAKFQAALDELVGTHDFRSFCTGYEQTSTVRTVTSIKVVFIKRYQAYRVIVQGPGFLRYMIRRMVGAALHVAANSRFEPSDIGTLLRACNPLHEFPTAPAQGLVLRKIAYKG